MRKEISNSMVAAERMMLVDRKRNGWTRKERRMAVIRGKEERGGAPEVRASSHVISCASEMQSRPSALLERGILEYWKESPGISWPRIASGEEQR